MREELAELWRYKHLLRMLVARELKIRYKNSVFGFLWSIVPPLLQVLVFTFLFRNVMGVSAKNIGAYMLCGIIPWSFFSAAVLDSSQSLLINYSIIRKVYIPREAIPLASVISNCVHFVLGWAVFFVAYVVVARFFGFGIPLLPRMLWFPVITFFEVILVTGLALWVSALNVFHEDVKFIIQTLFQLVYFVLPVLYPADQVYYSSHLIAKYPLAWKLYMLNPITAIITAYRHMLLEPLRPSVFNQTLLKANEFHPADPLPLPFDGWTFGGACLISVGILYSGYWYFNRRKWQFVERP